MSSEPETPRPAPKKKRRFLRKRFIFLFLLILLIVGGLIAYPPLVKWGIREGLQNGLAPIGLTLKDIGSISVQLGHPIRVEDIRFERAPDYPAASQTELVVGSVEVALVNFWNLVFEHDHLISRISLTRVDTQLDLRETSVPPSPPSIPSTEPQPEWVSKLLVFVFPQQLELKESNIRLLLDGQYIELSNLNLSFFERRLGQLAFDYGKIRMDSGISLDIDDGRAITALNQGSIYLGDFAISPTTKIDSFTLDLARSGGPGLSAAITLGGGWLRLEAGFGAENGEPLLDASAWAGNIQIANVSQLLQLEAPAEGLLTEARFNFHGTPGKELDGNASIQLAASDFHWESRGWKSLELVGGWTHRQLFVSNFALTQKENLIAFKGKLGLGQGDFDLAKATFTLECNGDIKDLSELADLAGEDLRGTKGQAQFNGEFRGLQGQYDGHLHAAAQHITLRETPLGDLELGITAKGQELTLQNFALKNGKDSLAGKATFGVAAPHPYTATLKGNIANIQAYESLIPALTELQATGGLEIDWEGDGTNSAHSGAFTLQLQKLVLPWTPEGLNGKFVGTYSPESLYLSELDLRRGPLQLSLQFSAGKKGVFANHIRLTHEEKNLIAGQFYAPYDPFVLLAKKDWRDGLLAEKTLYADLRSRSVPIADLAALTGQSIPVQGNLEFSLKASGPLLDPLLEASLGWKNLRVTLEDGGEIAPFEGQLDLSSQKGRGSLKGHLKAPLVDPIQLTASFPLGFVENADTGLALADPKGPLEGKVLLPKTPLSLFAPFAKGVSPLEGNLSGSIDLSNNLFAPRINGLIQLAGGRIGFGRNAPSLEKLEAKLNFTGTDAKLDALTGTLGAGPFRVTANVNFADLAKLDYQINLKGEKILLARDPNVRLRANIDIQAKGNASGGNVSGAVRLVDGRIFKQLEITPLLVSADTGSSPLLLPNLAGLVPPPFDVWKIDLSIQNESPFLLAGNIAAGEIEPNIQVKGTLGNPLPEGEVILRNVRAFLPFSIVDVPEGHVYLNPKNPRAPELDVRGNSRVLEYNIQLFAYGPLDEANLILRSDPPLQQESILLMLTTGLAPGAHSGSGFGEAAIGQGGLLLLRAFARQFESDDVNLESLVNRLQIQAIPPITQGDAATLRGEFRLFDQISLMGERDPYGFFNAGVTYRLRLK